MTQHSGIVSSNPLVIVVDDDAAVRNSLQSLWRLMGLPS